MFRFQTVTLDPPQIFILAKNERTPAFLGLKKKNLHCCSWKYFFTSGRYILQTSNVIFFSEMFCSDTAMFFLSQISISKNERILVF